MCSSDLLEEAPPRPSPLIELRLLYVGRFVQAKGVHDLVEAAARLHRRGVPVSLRLVGSRTYSRPEYLDRLHDAVLREKMTEQVEFLHDVPREKLAECYQWAHALVMPSRHEGFCIPVVEALAHRCRVIATDAGSIPEVAGGLGRILPVGDVDALVRALEELQQSPRELAVVDAGSLPLEEWNQRVATHLSR